MEIQYVHVKTRSQFGKQCIFDDVGPKIEANVLPDRDLMSDYIYRNPCHVGIQNAKQFAVHEVQTTSAPTKESGMSHTEGGWPKELNPRDEEATARFRRRVEKDDIWPIRMKKLIQPMEHCILQNNAVDIYENFFDDMVSTELVLPLEVRTVNVYEDPQTVVRPITHLSWSPDHGKRLAVSYCSGEFEREPVDRNPSSYIWEIENPNKPLLALKASWPSVVLEYNPRDPSMLVSGLMSGQVCNWDIRQGNKPVQVSHLQFSHRSSNMIKLTVHQNLRNPANLVLWINAKTNTEFFSASTGGTIKWWDLRKLREPTETLVMDLENPLRGDVVRAIGVSSLQFETTMSTKFMAGMENGIVVSGTRKGKNPQEKMVNRFVCHAGPVIALERNPFSTKNFLTIGGWVARIWAEDTKEGNLIATKRDKIALTGGCWSTSRYSVFYLIDESGVMKIYDILVGMKSPVKTIRLCDNALKALTPHEDGNLVAVGNDTGKVYLVEFSEGLTTNMRNDKVLMTTYLERCSRYVKAVDNRLKELRLVIRQNSEHTEEPILSINKEKPKGTSKEVRGRESSLNGKKMDEKGTKNESIEEREKKNKGKNKKAKDSVISSVDPELDEAEARYYEVINKETEKYAEISALEETVVESPSGRISSPREKRKKHEESKVDRESSGIATKRLFPSQKKEDSEKVRGRKSRVGRSTRVESRFEEIVIIRKSKADDKQKEEVGEKGSFAKTDERKTEFVVKTGESEDRTEMIDAAKKMKKSPGKVKSDVKMGGKIKKRETRRKRVKMKKPCSDYVCQPEICCIDELGARKLPEKSVKIVPPAGVSAKESKTKIMIDEMLANLPKVASPDELGHLLDPITEETDEKWILSKKDERPRLLDARVKTAKRETGKWREWIIKRKLIRPMRLQPAKDEAIDDSGLNKIFDDTDEINRQDSKIIQRMSSELGNISIVDVENDERPRIERENYTEREGKIGATRKDEIPIDCAPASVKFGEKDMKEIIGIHDVPRPPSRPKFDETRKKITRTKKDYPRISAAAIPELDTRDESSPK